MFRIFAIAVFLPFRSQRFRAILNRLRLLPPKLLRPPHLSRAPRNLRQRAILMRLLHNSISLPRKVRNRPALSGCAA